jgi:hypothetical protein
LNDENFEVKLPDNITMADDNTAIITDSDSDDEAIKKLKKELDVSAFDFKQTAHTYSRYLGGLETTSDSSVTLSDIDSYANNPQNSLDDIKNINKIIKQYVNKDDIIGKVYECVQIYSNTNYSLKYPELIEEKDKEKLKEVVEPLIKNFNEKINIKSYIGNGISTGFLEGNFISYLRTDKKSNKAVVDYYPVSMIEITEFNIDGEPAILFNVQELRSKLRITSRRKKNGKDIFYDAMEKLIKDNYPQEIYNAFRKNEKYALLDPKRVGLIRVNNLNGLYGLTPIFKALKPALLLESIENADETIVRVRAKKIVHQKLRKEVGGNDYTTQALDKMKYAHNNLLSAWKNKTVLVTTPWWVESIQYISDDTPLTDTNTLKTYRSRVFTALGINFVDTEANLNLSNISVKDLMKTIDKIAESLSDVINKYYKTLLEENGIDVELAPTIQIASSELLSLDMRKSLAEFIFTKLGGSYSTAYDILGVSSAETEASKRKDEKDNGYEETFKPHESFYTQSGSNNNDANGNGRPRGEENKKQKYDDSRKENKVE